MASKKPSRGSRQLLASVSRTLTALGTPEAALPKLTAEKPEILADPPGSEFEPIFDKVRAAEVQGNILPGFNKDYQHFLFFRMTDKKAAKTWLRWLQPRISSMADVLAFNRLYRSLRGRFDRESIPIKATWVNLGIAHAAIRALDKRDSPAFGDESYRQGLAARSTYLGDPTASSSPGHASKWKVGGPKNEADFLVIVASDDPKDLMQEVERIKEKAAAEKLTLPFEQAAATLPGDLRGHEHFGFKDGVSQPGVRGRLSAAPGDFLTPRVIHPADARAAYFAKPGQVLVWPGEFLLGEARQDPESLTSPGPAASNFPKWAVLGSYLVCRRLRQDVVGFWEFVRDAAAAVGLPDVKFASMLVGRWPSGAPLLRSLGGDNPALAVDDFANNHFLFEDNTRASSLRPTPGYPGDGFPAAVADVLGKVCPHFAHIRKTNPRDHATDLGKPSDTLMRLLLRRGIPYGKPIAGMASPTPALAKQDRGLMFLSYQASIEDQFEFVTRRWSNSAIHPNLGGHDLILGQSERYGDRTRMVQFPTKKDPHEIFAKRDFVIPTGGGYFFAPPISAIGDPLGV